MKLGELATRLGAELRGDAELEITGVKGLEEAGPTDLTFVANPRYTALARTTRAAAVLIDPDFQQIDAATLRIKNPYLAFSRALAFFNQPVTRQNSIRMQQVSDLYTWRLFWKGFSIVEGALSDYGRDEDSTESGESDPWAHPSRSSSSILTRIVRSSILSGQIVAVMQTAKSRHGHDPTIRI